MTDAFRKRLSRGGLLIGTIVSIPSPEVAEVLSLAGFDWLFVDMEHGTLDFTTTQRILQAASPSTPCLIRTPSKDEVWIKRCLDMGASGIIVPQVKSVDDAEAVIQFSKYPPFGSRGVGIARAHGYGTAFRDYLIQANDETAVVLQIEHIEAVKSIESIVEVPGIDAVFIGPYDLSASLGKIGEITDADVQDAISCVRNCAKKARIPLGIFAATVDSAKTFIQEGYRLIALGIDTMLLAGVAKEILASLR